MDLFELGGNHYLLVVEYLSKCPDLAKLESHTFKCVITHVKSMISKYGIPDIIISDNGPQFSCYEFKAGDPVMMQTQSGKLTSEFVIDLHSTKRSYVIQSKGRCYRRNRKFRRPTRVRSYSVSGDDVPAYTEYRPRDNYLSCRTTSRKTCACYS